MKRTPLKAIRAKCLDCSGTSAAVAACDFTDCGLYPYRSGHRSKDAEKTPIKAIRKECMDCCKGSSYEVSLCPADGCAIWPYRFGTNPFITLTEEERARRAALMRANRVSLCGRAHNAPAEGNYTPLPVEIQNPDFSPAKPEETREEVSRP